MFSLTVTQQLKPLSSEETRLVLAETEKVLKLLPEGATGLNALATLPKDPKEWSKHDFKQGWFADTRAGVFSLNHQALSFLYNEALDASENREIALKGTAIRLALVLLHEGVHLQSYKHEKEVLGFGWPLSSLQDEKVAIRQEITFYDHLMKDSKVKEILAVTCPPRNYLAPPGTDSSMTESFDQRLSSLSLSLQKKDERAFDELVKSLYPGAIDLLGTLRSKLEMELKAFLGKAKKGDSDTVDIETAFAIVSSPKQFEALQKML